MDSVSVHMPVPPDMARMDAQFALLLQPVYDRICSLEAELRKLSSQLHPPSLSSDSSSSSASASASASVTPPKPYYYYFSCAPQAPPQVHADAPMLTYDLAFQTTGGVEAVKQAAAVSKTIQARAVDPALTNELLDLFKNCSKRGYSTALVNQPFVSDLRELYEDAKLALPAFATLLQGVTTETGASQCLVANLKSIDRARAKSAFKYRDDYGVAWYRLTDLVRGTLVYPDIKAMYAALTSVASKFTIKEFNDRYQHPMPGLTLRVCSVLFFVFVLCHDVLSLPLAPCLSFFSLISSLCSFLFSSLSPL